MTPVPHASDLALPPEFDCDEYRLYNPDLTHFSDPELVMHYRQNGQSEGRRANALASRVDFARLIPNNAKSLEIGPFYNPLLRGQQVKYFDVLSGPQLIERAAALNIATANVPAIDYVSPTGDLNVVSERFDYILSSHCVEHQPDLIKHLCDIERILTDRGRYFALIPDKRYCFDHFISESTPADVLNAHHEQRKLHSLKSIIEHRVLTTHNDSGRHWNNDHGVYMHDYEARTAAALEEFAKSTGAYVDVHAWFFTPSSFARTLQILLRFAFIRLEVERLYPTRRYTNEFWVVLRKAE